MHSIFYGCSLISILFSVNAQYASECLTSSLEIGVCMPLKSCRNLYNIFELTIDNGNERLSEADMHLIQRSYCGTFNDVHHVCCLNSEIQLNIDGLEILTRTCGNRLTSRVSNGLLTSLYSFPWMALLKYNKGDLFQCGGSLISNRYVLTAAHCIKGQEGVVTHVRLGEYNISSDIDCPQNSKLDCAPPVEDIGIEESILPHNYVLRDLHHDIALLRLNRKVTYNRNIRPICLPLQGVRRQSNDHYIISGWGGTEMARSSNVLMAAVIKAINCTYAFPHLTYLNEGHICAGGENLIDSCRGDSGGPLGWRGTFAGYLRFIQYGIVSFGINSCGHINAPGVYTNVSHYMQWITDHIKA